MVLCNLVNFGPGVQNSIHCVCLFYTHAHSKYTKPVSMSCTQLAFQWLCVTSQYEGQLSLLSVKHKINGIILKSLFHILHSC